MTIESAEVLLTRPHFATAPKVSASRLSQRIANGQAPQQVTWNGMQPTHGWRMEFVLRSRANVQAFEEFFYARKGKWNHFWVPSWHAELNPLETLSIGETALDITPVNYATVYDPTKTDGTQLGNYIFLASYAGDLHVSKVNSVSGTSPEVLVLADAPAVDFTLGQYIAGFVYKCRFAQDELDITWKGATNATTEVGIMEIITSTPAADVP